MSSGALVGYAGVPTSETVIHVTIRANSLGELREQLQKAMDEMGWAPQTVQAENHVAEARAAEAAAGPAIETTDKPKRTRKAKEEAPAEPAADPTSTSTPPAPAVAPSADTAPSTAPGPQSDATAEKASSSTPAAPSSTLTHEAVKKAAEAWMAAHPDGVPQAKKEIRGYLASFGVSRVAELPVESLQDFLDTIEGV
jgi:cobalamin biosynthesis Mg chelatase CobN